MDTRFRSRDDDSGPGPDLEFRLARTPFLAPPASLKAACLATGHRRSATAEAARETRTGLWLRVWNEIVRPHPLAWGSLAAAWALILGLRLTTPDLTAAERPVLVQVPEETRKAAAAERAALMASLRVPDLEPAPSKPAPAERPPRRVDRGDSRILSPRSQAALSDRFA